MCHSAIAFLRTQPLRGAHIHVFFRRSRGSFRQIGKRGHNACGHDGGIAVALCEQQSELGQEQRLVSGPGAIDGVGQSLVDVLEVLERHVGHRGFPPRQADIASMISSATAVRQRPATCRSGRSR